MWGWKHDPFMKGSQQVGKEAGGPSRGQDDHRVREPSGQAGPFLPVEYPKASVGRLGAGREGSTPQMTGSPEHSLCPRMLEWRLPEQPWPSPASPSWCHMAVAGPEHAEVPPVSGGSLNALSPTSPHPITVSLPHTHRHHAPSLLEWGCRALAPRQRVHPRQQEPLTQGTVGQWLP